MTAELKLSERQAGEAVVMLTPVVEVVEAGLPRKLFSRPKMSPVKLSSAEVAEGAAS